MDLRNEYLSETYKGFDIDVIRDDMAQNPFEDWDGLLGLIYEFGRGNTGDYSNGDIDDFLDNYLSDNQLIYHQQKLLDMTGEDFDEGLTRQEKIDCLSDMVFEFVREDIKNKEIFCDTFGIKYYSGDSRGYLQGDYAKVFICWTPEFESITGRSYKSIGESDFKACIDLFTAWAWGDVYIIDVDEVDFCVGGFYGDCGAKDGIKEAKAEIDRYLDVQKEKREQKLKGLIANNVPLGYRANELESECF